MKPRSSASRWDFILPLLRILPLLLLLVPLLGPLPASAAAVDEGAQRASPCYMSGHGNMLRCLKVTVPQDYAQPKGASMEVQVIIAPAVRPNPKADPLFVLAGGPGQAGSDVLPLLDSAFRQIRTSRDVVFIDQRGTGMSGKLDCESTRGMEALSMSEQEAVLARCFAGLKKPFSTYTTDAAARDLDAVRLALGYRSVNLWGGSYGTRLAQAYARLFPTQTRAMILDGVAAPEQIIFAWGRDAQASFDTVLERCANDAACRRAYPDTAGQFKTLLQRVKSGKVELTFAHPRTATTTRLTLQTDSFQQTIRAALYQANAATRLPFVIDNAARGNWAPFLSLLYAPDDFRFGGIAPGLMLAVTCAEDIPRLTPTIVAEEERASFLEGSEVKIFPRLCKLVNVPALASVAPTRIDAPVLLLSGELDPVTPPRRAEQARSHMAKAQHVTVANVGHGVSNLGCAPRLMRRFLDQPEETLDAACLSEISPGRFQLGAAGPQP